MTYKITAYSRKQAKKLGVTIKLSKNPSKKLDVFKNGKKVASIGSIGYFDYPTFMEKEGIYSASAHRRKYKIRHAKDMNVKGSAGFFAAHILW
jgi:hypothetical protein